MTPPRFERPTYFLRSRAGETLGPFSFQEVIDQLAQRKITNDGEIRRQGWEVLEKDELWGKVRDFPIFGHSGPAGRQELRALQAKARKMLLLGAVLLAGAVVVFVTLFFLPYRETEQKMEEAQRISAKAKLDNAEFQKRLEDQVATAKKQWVAEFDANLKKWEADLAKLSDELARSRGDTQRAKEALDSQKQANGRLQEKVDSVSKALAMEQKLLAAANSRVEDSDRRAQELEAGLKERLREGEAKLKQEFEELMKRNADSDGGNFLRKPKNPLMGYVLNSGNQGRDSLVLLVSQRPPAGTRLQLYDGKNRLNVIVTEQGMGPPYMVVDVESSQPRGASSLSFLGIEVIVSPRP